MVGRPLMLVVAAAGCLAGTGGRAPMLRVGSGVAVRLEGKAGDVVPAALWLRGGCGESGAGVAGKEMYQGMDSELSPELSAMLADPEKRELAYNLTVAEFHREQDKAGGMLPDEKVARYFHSHMLLRHQHLEPSEYTEQHYIEFAHSFYGVSDTEEDRALLDSLDGMWAGERERGGIGDWKTAREEDIIGLSAKYLAAVRRPLLHVPRDMLSLDQALAELADGGTLLVGSGDFVPSVSTVPERGLEHGDGECKDQGERSYIVEADRHALLIRGSLVEQSGRDAGASPMGCDAQGEAAVSSERALHGDDSREEEEGREVVVVGEVDDIVTRVWGRWELACDTLGQVEYMQMLLSAPSADLLTESHTRRALVSVAGSWLFQNCSMRCSLSVALTAVCNASVTMVGCGVGGIGEAEGTREAEKYASVLGMEARHRQRLSQAEVLEADADAWHQNAMYDAEMEAKIAELQDPNFLVSTPGALLDEAAELVHECRSDLSRKLPSLDAFDDVHNREQMLQFQAAAGEKDSLLWTQVAARCEDAVLLFDKARLVMEDSNVSLVDVVEGSALRAAEDSYALVEASQLRDAAFAVSLQGGACVNLTRVEMLKCSRFPLQAAARCDLASIALAECRVTCWRGRAGLWAGDARPGAFSIQDGDNVFEEETDNVMADVLRGEAFDFEEMDRAEDEMEAEHKKQLEARLASMDVNQDIAHQPQDCPPGRRILFASDNYAAPV